METLQNIQNDLTLLEDWTDKYAYLIDLGKTLPPFPADKRLPEYEVQGCTSKVWLVMRQEEGSGVLQLHVDSDALIVKGLLALVYSAYVGKTPAEARQVDIETDFTTLGLAAHLTPNRRHGFAAMVAKVKAFCEEAGA